MAQSETTDLERKIGNFSCARNNLKQAKGFFLRNQDLGIIENY